MSYETRKISIKFSSDKAVEKPDLYYILKKLPEDAALCTWGQSLEDHCHYMVFESQQFIVTPEAQRLPVVVWKVNGELDLAPVLEKKEKIIPDYTGMTIPKIDWKYSFNSLYNSQWDFSEHYKEINRLTNVIYKQQALMENPKIYISQDKLTDIKFSKDWTMGNVEFGDNALVDPVYKDDVDSIVSASEKKYKDTILKLDNCVHEWKAYEGVMYNYNFCTKCDIKKT